MAVTGALQPLLLQLRLLLTMRLAAAARVTGECCLPWLSLTATTASTRRTATAGMQPRPYASDLLFLVLLPPLLLQTALARRAAMQTGKEKGAETRRGAATKRQGSCG
jgi:hypothetical protein